MNVTPMINKILSDYNNKELNVNFSIKYRFMYNGFQTDIFYSSMNGLQNQLLISINVNDIDYLTTLYFSKNGNDEYFMNYYLPPELYKNVKFTLLYVNGKCSTTPYFEQMVSTILNTTPISTNFKNYSKHRNMYKYKNHVDNPFFETFVRVPMSPGMVNKINCKYDKNTAHQIFKYCGKIKTLRFTSDITKSKDILTFINQPT